MKRMIGKALDEQVAKINQILNVENDEYTLDDVFNMLPCTIKYRNRVGHLKISKFDIVYSSIETEMKAEVVNRWSFMIGNENIFDAFIYALEWFEKYKQDIEILEK